MYAEFEAYNVSVLAEVRAYFSFINNNDDKKKVIPNQMFVSWSGKLSTGYFKCNFL